MNLYIKQRMFLNKKGIKALKAELDNIYGDKINDYFKKGINIEEGKLNNGGLIIIIEKEAHFFKLKTQILII